jgi:hypothetical protein
MNEPIMTNEELQSYRSMPKPAGGPRGTSEFLENTKWHFASLHKMVGMLEAEEMLASKVGEPTEATQARALQSHRYALAQAATCIEEHRLLLRVR